MSDPAEDMVERVARAICAESFDGDKPDDTDTRHYPAWMAEADLLALGSDQDAPEYYYLSEDGTDFIYAVRKWRWYVPAARAAIGAMLEPTEAMVAQAADTFMSSAKWDDRRTEGHMRSAWQAMITTALKPEGK